MTAALNIDALPADLQALVRQHAAALVCDPTKDKRYLTTQLGSAIADYLSWKEHEDGAAPTTLDSYERILAALAVSTDKELGEVTIDDLRNVRDSFTRGQARKVTAVLKDFWRWQYEEGRVRDNPAGRLRYPRRELKVVDDTYTDLEKAAIVTAQTDPMDQTGVLLLLRAGLRKAELRGLQVRDVNLAEKYVIVRRGKGGKGRKVPIKGELVRALDLLLLSDPPRGERDYILCPTRGGQSTTRVPSRPMGVRGAHEWWYRCLRRAGLVEEGVSSGRRMHAARHTYATDLGRATNWNMVAVQKNLGHASIRTTVDIYTHFAFDDQADAVQALPEIGDESSEIVPKGIA